MQVHWFVFLADKVHRKSAVDPKCMRGPKPYLTEAEVSRLVCTSPYFGKRKQVKIQVVKEQNVSVISTDINGISCLTLT